MVQQNLLYERVSMWTYLKSCYTLCSASSGGELLSLCIFPKNMCVTYIYLLTNNS